MPTIAELIYRADARELVQAKDALRSMTAEGGRAETQTEKLTQSQQALANESRSVTRAAASLGGALAGLGVGALVTSTLQLADTYTGMQNRLGLATTSTLELARASQSLYDVAQDTRVGLEATVDLYSSLQRSTQALGVSQDRLLGVTETINQALVVSGANAGAAQAALTQLGQGFASGTLRGDELNSVLEQTPRLAKAIADGMGITVGQLRALGAEGKITGETVFNALEGQADKIEREFDGMAVTIGQAFTQLQNGALSYVGEADQAAGVSRTLAEGISLVAQNIDTLADAAVAATAVIATAGTVMATRYLAVTVATTASNIALGAAINGMSASAAAGSIAMRGLGVSMAFFGGPIGLAILGVSAAVASLGLEAAKTSSLIDSAASAADAAEDQLGAMGLKAAQLGTQTANVGVASLGAALGVESFGGKAGVAAQQLYTMAAAAKAAAYESLKLQREKIQEQATELTLRTAGGRRADVNKDYGTGLGAFGQEAGAAFRFVAGEGNRLLDGGKRDREAESALADLNGALAKVDAGLREVAQTSEEKYIPASTGAAAAAAKATGGARAQKTATDELAQALKQATSQADSYLASLRQQNSEYGRSSSALLEMAAMAQRALAPTLALKLAIGEQGDYAVGFERGAQAIRDINEAASNFTPLPQPDFEGNDLDDLIEQLRSIDQVSLDAARGMEQAFGGMGRAIGGITTSITGYRAAVASLAKQQKDGSISMATQIREERSLRVGSYGDMVQAGREYFKEGSTGYELLLGAERAFRIVEFGLALQSIATKASEATATVAAEGAMTAATVAGTAVRTPLKAAEGVAGIFAALGPFAFPVAAAAIAVMAAAGVKGLSGSGGSVPGATDMQDRQKAQGAGSVLGDASAKSDSIAKSLEIMASNTNKDLEYSNSMLKALRSIDDQIGAVAAALAQTLSAGGALDTAGLNLGKTTDGPGLLQKIINPLAAVLPGLFGSKTTRTLQDQGIKFGSGSIDEILSGGLAGSTYQQVLQETKKKFLGVTYSDKTKSSTTTGALDQGFLDQTTALIDSLRTAVLEGAKVLGVEGAQALVDQFEVNLGTLSFKDMDGAAIQSALNAIFGKLGDDLAATAIPALDDLQKVGEGAFETLARVVRGYQVVDVSLSSIGKEFGAVGVASLQARERLIDLTGGIDAFAEQTSFFAENYLTEAERLAPVQAAVAKELARLGAATVDTKDEFKALVLGLDVSTAAGAEMYAALLALAPAFAKVTDAASQAASDAADNVDSARDRLADAYARQADVYRDAASSLRDYESRFREFREGLISDDLKGGGNAGVEFDRIASLASLGNKDAMDELIDAGQRAKTASEGSAKTLVEHLRTLSAISTGVQAAEDTAGRQASIAEQELRALDALVAAQIPIGEGLISVGEGLSGLALALASLQTATGRSLGKNPSANAALAAATGYSGSFGTGGFQAWIVEQEESIKAEARRVLQAYGQDYRISGFQTGGSFEIGGNGPADTRSLGPVPVSPGEIINVTRDDSMAQMALEIRSLREELIKLNATTKEAAADQRTTARTLQDVTRGGEAMLTEAA